MPNPTQNPLDWMTQKWVMLFGRKIKPKTDAWLIGPCGGTTGIGQKLIAELMENEGPFIDNIAKTKGLIPDFKALNLPEHQLKSLDPRIIDFYQSTSDYQMDLSVEWAFGFKFWGRWLQKLFGHRLQQLNIPINNSQAKALKSEIIHLRDTKTHQLQRIIWLRSFENSGQVVYSGVYSVTAMPSGDTAVKAVFPLPNGNATVILTPSMGGHGQFVLTSSGRKTAHGGFYFLLKDAKAVIWQKSIRAFEDELSIESHSEGLKAVQNLRLWGLKVLTFEYRIQKITPPKSLNL